MPLVRIDTAWVPEADRLDFWRSTVCDQFVALDVEPSAGPTVDGHVSAVSVGDVHVRRISSGPHRFVRTAAQVRAADEDYLQIALARRGRTLVVQDGRETTIGPGEFVLYDSSRPFSFVTSDDFEYAVCLHPKQHLPLSRAEMAAVTATRFDGTRGIGAMLPPLLESMYLVGSGDLSESAQGAVTQVISDLFVALVRDRIAPGASDNTHLARARAHIREHIADRDLDPASVASACAISVSYLHKLFGESGTSVAATIREERLQGCWRDLRRPELATLTVAAIGHRWGIVDPAHLSRAFRARFGCSPSAHRAG